MGLEQEINAGEGGRLHRLAQRHRSFMARHLLLFFIYRAVIITLGFLCVVAGIIMLVTPGPGWLFIFMGMSLWGTEFHWAHRLNIWAKAKVLSVWRELEARRNRRHRAKMQARWAKRRRADHYCPNAEHYH